MCWWLVLLLVLALLAVCCRRRIESMLAAPIDERQKILFVTFRHRPSGAILPPMGVNFATLRNVSSRSAGENYVDVGGGYRRIRFPMSLFRDANVLSPELQKIMFPTLSISPEGKTREEYHHEVGLAQAELERSLDVVAIQGTHAHLKEGAPVRILFGYAPGTVENVNAPQMDRLIVRPVYVVGDLHQWEASAGAQGCVSVGGCCPRDAGVNDWAVPERGAFLLELVLHEAAYAKIRKSN